MAGNFDDTFSSDIQRLTILELSTSANLPDDLWSGSFSVAPYAFCMPDVDRTLLQFKYHKPKTLFNHGNKYSNDAAYIAHVGKLCRRVGRAKTSKEGACINHASIFYACI